MSYVKKLSGAKLVVVGHVKICFDDEDAGKVISENMGDESKMPLVFDDGYAVVGEAAEGTLAFTWGLRRGDHLCLSYNGQHLMMDGYWWKRFRTTNVAGRFFSVARAAGPSST